MLKKKIIVLYTLVSVLLLGSVFSCPVYAAGTVNEQTFNNAATLLSDIGIIKNYDDVGVPADRSITRIDFVKLFVKFFYGDVQSGTQNLFTDVEKSGEDAQNITLAYERGLINGDGKGKFRPYDNITYDEAIVISVNALGYDGISGILKYPADYRNISRSADLGKGISNYNGKFSVADAYILVYNTLRASVLEISGMSSGAINYSSSDEILLTKCRDIYKIDGILTGTCETVLTGQSGIDEGKIQVTDANGDNILLSSEKDYPEHLGYIVTVFCKETSSGIDEVVSMVRSDKGYETTYIMGEDVVKYRKNSRELVFEKAYVNSDVNKKSSLKKMKIPVTSNIIYNGQSVTDNDVVFDRINDAVGGIGELNIYDITIIDYDKTKEIDVVVVNMYQNVVVDYVTGDGKVADYYGGTFIDLNEEDATTVIYSPEGEVIKPKDVKKYDVLSVRRGLGKKPYVRVDVTADSIDGFVDSKKMDGVLRIVTINGEEYIMANSVKRDDVYEKLARDKEYMVLSDIRGLAAAYILNSKVSEKVGYVIKAQYERKSDRIRLRIYSPDDSSDGASIYNNLCSEKVRIDRQRITEQDTYDYAKLQYTMIRYTVNEDGEITKIETAKNESGVDTLSYAASKPADRKQKLTYKGNLKLFAGSANDIPVNLAFDNDTIFLQVPIDASVADPDECCKRLSAANFTNDYLYTVDGFMYDENDITCRVILRYYTNSITEQDYDKNFMVISKKYMTVNNDDEVVEAIDGYLKGFPATVYSMGTNFVDAKGNAIDLKSGDIVQISRDYSGAASSVKRVYDVENDNYDAVAYSGETNASNRVIIGKAYYVKQPFILIVEKGKTEMIKQNAQVLPMNSATRVYLFNKDTNTISMGSQEDIVGYANGDRPGNRLVARTSYASSSEIVIYLDK